MVPSAKITIPIGDKLNGADVQVRALTLEMLNTQNLQHPDLFALKSCQHVDEYVCRSSLSVLLSSAALGDGRLHLNNTTATQKSILQSL